MRSNFIFLNIIDRGHIYLLFYSLLEV